MIESIISISGAARTSGIKSAERATESVTEESTRPAANRDEYVPSEEREPLGLYRVSPDEPKPDETESDKVTANTDAVDREIKSLKDKERVLTQKLRTANEVKAEDIRRQLEQIRAELSLKSSDQYRRQNAVFS